ncbi:MAG: C25 family cysteine peptidase [Candidatus Krumholzibacteriia bacterium]
MSTAAALAWGTAALGAGAPAADFVGQFGGELSWETTAEGTVTPRLADSRAWAETGRPALATRDLSLLVPLDAAPGGVEVVALATHRVPVPGRLAAGSPLISSEGVAVVAARLALDGAAFPAQWGEFGGTQVWRGFRLAAVRIYPLRAVRDAAGEWSELEVLDRYAIRLLPGSAGATVGAAAQIAVRERQLPGERARAEALLAGLIANPAALPGYVRADGAVVAEPTGGFAPSQTPSLEGSPVRYLIITREALAPAFQRLADHRTALGDPAVVQTVEWIEANYRHGADVQETIRLFIREAYQRWGVEYVLLGGDSDIIPPRYVNSTYYPPGESTDVPADLYYGCLDGNWNADADDVYGEPYTNYLLPGDNVDLADEVRVGRAAVSTVGAVDAFIDKVIAYEAQAAQSPWPNRMLFAAEVLFPADYTAGATILLDGASFAEQLNNTSLTDCTGMTTARMYESYPLWPGSTRLSRAAFIDSVNTGHYGIVNQVGHGFFVNMSLGDANFTVADADGLHNTGRSFLLYALNCASAAFDYACLMERFVQNPDGGAVAAIGAARAAFPYTANFYQTEFFRLLFCTDTHRLGDLMSLSRLPRLADTIYNTADRWTVLNYTLLGDPGLAVWAGSPRAATVSAPTSLATGAQTVTVTVTTGGQPVAGALVCLSKAGDDYASDLTDAAGQVTLAYTPTSSGTARLVVSGAGLAQNARDLPVTTAGAYIALDTVTLVDNGTYGSIGNGDGRFDAGETVAIFTQYRDTGTGGALSCLATLSGGAAGLTILDGTANVGNVPSGGVKAATDPFLVRADGALPDGLHVAFSVTVTAPVGGPYASEWNPVILAPELSPISLTWSDQTFGNGDGTQQNGERITITVKLKNYGAGLSGPITGRLRTLDPAVILSDTVATYAPLALLQEGVGATPFSLAETDVSVDHPCWILFSDSLGRTVRHDFQLNAPAAPTGPSANTTFGPDVISLTWPPVTTPHLRGYHVYRSTSGSGPFTRANVDLIERTSYFRDAGLALLTQYFYRVTAVDSSLIEGPPSAVISQSTAPPELSGFPLPMAKETSGHNAVGDVDGDGKLEIVLGGDEVYVWTATGGELRDGDNDAQTLGPFTHLSTSTTVLSFSPAGITLADLDDVPGLEIIASERIQNKIHIFRRDGSELPGWPQSLVGTSWNWTTPAVGDVDGDGSPEIVCNDIAGRTMAWHVNGTELRDGDNDPATTGVFVARPNAVWEYSWSSPALCDLDHDGRKEIIFGSKYGNLPNYLYAYRYDGTQAAGFPFATGNYGTILCSPSLGDLDNDGRQEIVFVSEADSLYVLREDARRYPGFPIAFVANNSNVPCPSPALADFDNDGRLELAAVATANASSAALRLIDTDIAGGTSGQTMPGWPKSLPGNSESSPLVGDIDNDGMLDIVYGIGGGSESTPNNLYAFKASGAAVPGFPITVGGPIRPCPVLCDLDGDGQVNIVYGGWDLQVHVWSLPFAYNPDLMPWPTFRGSNRRDGVYRRATLTGTPGEAPPAVLAVAPNYPNPFNPVTTVRLYVPGPAGGTAPLGLRVYNLQGRLVRVLHSGPSATGWRTWIWDGRDGAGQAQASGIYLLRAEAAGQVRTQKMALVK